MAGKSDLQFEAKISLAEFKSLFNELKTGAESAAQAINDAFGQTTEKRLEVRSFFDDKGIRQYEARLRKTGGVGDQILRKLDKESKIEFGSVTNLRQTLNQLKQVRDQTVRFKPALGAYGNEVRKVNDAWAEQNKKVREVERKLALAEASGFWAQAKAGLNIQGLLSFGNGLTEIVQTGQAASIVIGQLTAFVGQFTQALGRLQEFALSFKAINAGAAGGQQALGEASRIALGLGVNLETVRQAFQQLTPVIKNSGGSIGDVASIVETLSSRFAAFGISGERARRVTNGVIQAFAKGKLMAEELTQQISEADPAFKTDLAAAIGISVAELEQWVKAGRITTDVMLEFIPELSKADILFGRLGITAKDAAASLLTSGTTLAQVQNRIQGLNQLSLERLSRAFEPALVAIVSIGAAISDFLDRVSRLDVVESIGGLFTVAANAVGGAIEAFLGLAEAALRIADVVTTFVKVLAQIPGAAELIGAALLLRVAGPLNEITKNFALASKEGTSALSKLLQPLKGFGKEIGGISSGIIDAFRPLQAESKKLDGLKLDASGFRQSFSKVKESIRSLDKPLQNVQNRIDQLSARRRAAVTTGLSPARIEELDRRLGKLRDGQQKLLAKQGALTAQASRAASQWRQSSQAVEGQRKALAGLRSSSAGVSGALLGIRNAANVGLKGIGNLFASAANAARGFAAAIGPVGAALAVVAIVTAAYQEGVKGYNNAISDSKQRIEAIDAAIKELTGSTSQGSQEISTWTLIWKNFSAVIASIGGVLSGLFDTLREIADGTTTKSFLELAASLAAIAGIAAVIGAAFAGPVLAAILAVTAVIGGLALSGNAAGARLRDLQERLRGIGDGAKKEGAKLRELGVEVEKLAKARATRVANGGGGISSKEDVKELAKITAGYKQMLDGIEAMESQQAGLKKEAAGYKEEIDKVPPAIKKVLPELQELAELQDKAKRTGGLEGKVLEQDARVLRSKIDKALEADGVDLTQSRASIDKTVEVLRSLGLVKAASKGVNDELAETKSAFDDMAAAAGLLTLDQLEDANTIEKVKKSISELQTQLENAADPDINTAKWEDLSRRIGAATVEAQRLEDSTSAIQNIAIAASIDEGITDGRIADSLQNVSRQVQALEGAAVTLDIDSPELPGVIRDLVAAEQKADELNGRRAEITLAIVQEGGFSATINNFDRTIKALETRFRSVDLLGPGADAAIREIRAIQTQRDLAEKTSDELRSTIHQNRLDDIQSERTAAKSASDARISDLREELDQVDRIAQRQVDALSKPGPAEQALKRLREQELRADAGKGGRRGLEAAAELERLRKQEQITRIQEAAARKKEAIENQIRAEEKVARQEEKANRDEELKIQRELLEIAREKRKEETLYAKQILAARGGGGDGLSPASGAPPGGAAEAARTAIEMAVQAQNQFNQALAASAIEANIFAAAIERVAGLTSEIAKNTTFAGGQFQIIGPAAVSTGEGMERASLATSSMVESVPELVRPLALIAETAVRLPSPFNEMALSVIRVANAMTIASQRLLEGASSARQAEDALRGGAEQAERLARAIAGLSGVKISVSVSAPGRWTGGPVAGGQLYRVNELGQEGFLSSTGGLSPIRRARNSLWKAPGSGTVIPAGLWSQINAPTNSIKANDLKGAIPGVGGSTVQRLIRAMQSGLQVKVAASGGLEELASVQAHQAQEIGKLGRAVSDLTRKDWNVNVKVRPRSGASYLTAINSRL